MAYVKKADLARDDRFANRRRKGSVGGQRKNLTVDEDQLDRYNWEYRFITGDEARVYQMTKSDDWELVSDPTKSIKEDGTDLGSPVSIVAGTSANGAAIRQYLVRKPKDFFEADKAEVNRALDDKMEAIERGPSQETSAAGLTQPYVPTSGIKIRQGAKV